MQAAISVMQAHRESNAESPLLRLIADSCNDTLRCGLSSGEQTRVVHTLSFLQDAGAFFPGDKARVTAEVVLALRSAGSVFVRARVYDVLQSMVGADSLPSDFLPDLLKHIFACSPLASEASDNDAQWPLLVAK